MNAWRQGSAGTLLCLCSALACAAELPPDGGTQNVGAATAINPVAAQPLDQLSATHERPLFSPTRQPPPKPVAAVVRADPPPPPPPPPSVVLLGIVSEDGDSRAAIRPRDKDKVVRVRTGDDVSGWKVERIEPRRLVLTLGERSVDFSLFGAATKATKTADAAAPERRARPVH